MLRNEGDRLRRVVVSAPTEAYASVTDLQMHNFEDVVNREEATRQFDQLVAVMQDWAEVVAVPELRGHPNSVFPRDVALMTPEGYVVLRMGLSARRGEERWMADALERLGADCAGSIEPEGTLEGGDVILAGSVAFVGLSRRSNEDGVRQLRSLLMGMGYTVRVAPIPDGYLHLGGPMSAIAPDRLLACRGVFPPGFFDGFDVVEVDPVGQSTGNVICLRANEVIADAENLMAVRALERSGVRVHCVQLSEFRKGSAGPSCLILPLDRWD